ncbi:zinc finger MYND domain-containing protein 12-like isoform X1 [Centruroides sculpturatus]|uniref:zinc finger MYND domain-containing protein 12-like isoform X1 n=2 Tax=Centruroides sculpturatus TaxID=218467 RepID=UPI000C6E55DB|nr:zinc finger MYND domain-containing protein 12-like isoform X1 [Centruroides sculpturatus]
MECQVCRRLDSTLCCTECKTAFYCSSEHQQNDWVSLHKDICNKLLNLQMKASSTVKGSRQIRQEIEKLKKEIYVIATLKMEEYFMEGKYHLSLPALSQCLQWCPELFGDNSKEFIIPYSILAEICLDCKDLQQATHAISFAEWIDKKTKHKSDNKILATLNRARGRLSLAENKLKNAIYFFSENIVYAVELLGMNHVGTACSYYYLGEALYRNGDKQGSFSALQKMATLWEECLMDGVSVSWVEELKNKSSVDPPQIAADHCQIVEGFRMTLMLAEWCYELSGDNNSSVFLKLMFSSFHSAGMFYLLEHDLNKGKDCFYQANLAGIQCYRDSIIDPIDKELKHVTDIFAILNK